MPKYKLKDIDRKRILELKKECPCLSNAAVARIFNLSPSRISEVVREVKRDRSKK